MQRLKSIIVVLSSLLILLGILPLTIIATNLLTNGGFNKPFNDIPDRVWNGQYEKIADGWSHFYLDETTYPGSGNASKLHWMSSAQFASAFGGYDYFIEGDASQVMWSSYEYDAGVYQQVSSLSRGNGYKFFIKMATFWRGPGYSDTNGVMVKQVGIDPYGGTDPTSPDVIWSNTDADDKAWVGMQVAATAEGNAMTVFAKVDAPENDSYNHTDLDMVFFEDARLEYVLPGPTTTLNASTTGLLINANWASPAPGPSIKGYEVQYQDQAGGDWITLQDKTNQSTSGSFMGQAGHTYTIRARTWQTDGTLDLPGLWVETSVLVGNVVTGQVTDHAGMGLSGVTVMVSSTTTSTISSGGQFNLVTGPGDFEVIANNFNGLVAPPAAAVTVPPGGAGYLTITLRPTDVEQAIRNNDFETDLSDWSVSDGAAAGVSTLDRHTGHGSLRLSNAVNVSQTGVVTGMQRPLLSLWYQNDVPFTVEFLGEGVGTTWLGATDLNPQQTRTLEAVGEWTHFIMALGATDVYTGSVGVNFSYNGGAGANIFIDEVSIAAGPYQTYLPVVFKE
ncbi:MAG: fibronectin type III domain-containing protein [Anaerolineae bacterium]|nr:fibronectin type III domain-containing protein [Anaerolineae bacterium]